MMKTNKLIQTVLAIAGTLLLATSQAQTVKIGFMGTYSGPGAAQGDQLDKGLKLYMKLNGKINYLFSSIYIFLM